MSMPCLLADLMMQFWTYFWRFRQCQLNFMPFASDASLSRPGGNLTGFNLIAGPLPAKQLGILHELVPAAKTIAVLINPNNANAERDAATVQDAAGAIGVQILVMRAAVESDFETVFATIARERAGALLANSDVFFTSAIKSLRWRPAMRFPSLLHGANFLWPAA
jgi:putative tryptophan/tyrosine transport system substrate-binding protein